MHKLFRKTRINLISKLPVPFARRYVQREFQGESTSSAKQLLVDISVLINKDARTGIQRVVRALLLQLIKNPPQGYIVRPVFATRQHGYYYGPKHFGLPEETVLNMNRALEVQAASGDIFLGLDFAPNVLPLCKAQLQNWKYAGVSIHMIIYDLLPLLHPQWFNAKSSKNFKRWLKTVAIFADSAICISQVVKAQLEIWLAEKYKLPQGAIPISTIPLGADIAASAPSCGLPDNVEQLMASLNSQPTVLMVGTLEPRKAHYQVLAAFEKMWQQGQAVNLLIVGRAGWKTESLQQCLRLAMQKNNRLQWLDDASDELLELLYKGCAGVIVASRAEGYGLPLVEAEYHGKPVLARDIAVLREIAGESVTFFSDDNDAALAVSIQQWLAEIATQPKVCACGTHTWRDSAEALLASLKLTAMPKKNTQA